MNSLTVQQTLMKHLINIPSSCLSGISKDFVETTSMAGLVTKQKNKPFHENWYLFLSLNVSVETFCSVRLMTLNLNFIPKPMVVP